MPYFQPFSSMPKFAAGVSINPASVAAATISVQTFTVAGLTTDMIPVVGWPGTAEFADIRIISARVSAKNTLELTFENFNGSSARDLATFTINVIGL